MLRPNHIFTYDNKGISEKKIISFSYTHKYMLVFLCFKMKMVCLERMTRIGSILTRIADGQVSMPTKLEYTWKKLVIVTTVSGFSVDRIYITKIFSTTSQLQQRDPGGASFANCPKAKRNGIWTEGAR